MMGPFSISKARRRKMRKKRYSLKVTKLDKFIICLGALMFFGGSIGLVVALCVQSASLILWSLPAIGLGFQMMIHIDTWKASGYFDEDF